LENFRKKNAKRKGIRKLKFFQTKPRNQKPKPKPKQQNFQNEKEEIKMFRKMFRKKNKTKKSKPTQFDNFFSSIILLVLQSRVPKKGTTPKIILVRVKIKNIIGYSLLNAQ